MKFSIYKGSLTKSEGEADLTSVINLIQGNSKINEELQNKTNMCHSLYDTYLKSELDSDKKIYNTFKSTLPTITWGGTFQPSKRAKNTISIYSNLIVLDIDGIKSEDEMQIIYKKLICDQHIFILFRSPSNHGFKIVMKLNYPTKDNIVGLDYFYTNSYINISNYIKNNYDINPDQSCKDVNRLCYLPIDENIVFNKDSDIFDTYPTILEKYKSEFCDSKNSDIEKENVDNNIKLGKRNEKKKIKENGILPKLLEKCQQNSISFDFKEWTCLAFIVYDEMGKVGFEMFKAFSIIDKVKYKEYECIQKWDYVTKKYDSSKSPNIKKLVSILQNKGLDLELAESTIKEEKLKYDDNDLPFLIDNTIGKCYIDEIKDDIFIKNKKTGEMIFLDNHLRNKLMVEIKKDYINCTKSSFDMYFEQTDNVEYFNPIKDKFSEIITQDDTEFNKLVEYFSFLQDPNKEILKIKRWMLGVLTMVYDDGKHFDSMLILKGRQDGGKSYFVREQMLKIFKDLKYLCEKFNYEESHKSDYQKMMSRNAIILDDESNFSKKECDMVKRILSTAELQYIEKFEKNNTYKRRLATFIGTTNQQSIYDDPTGGKRFHIIDLGEHYLPGARVCGKLMTPEFILDWNKIWGYVYFLFTEGTRHTDIEYTNDNEVYSQLTPLELLVKEYCEIYEYKENNELMKFRDIRTSINSIAYNQNYNIKHLIDSPRGLASALKTVFGDKLVKYVAASKKDTFYNVRMNYKCSVDNQETFFEAKDGLIDFLKINKN